MGVAQLLNVLSHYALNASFGLVPRSERGLVGIFFSPFLHASWAHLSGNLIPFMVLSVLVVTEGVRRYLTASILIVFIGGMLVWMFGRYASVVGCSGWVFGLWAYILGRAWYRHNWANLGMALALLVFYSGMVYGFLPRAGVSFEAHIAGAVAGFITAKILLAGTEAKPKRKSLAKDKSA